jgi:cellulose synthase/poly-beta-1,6-N-acetylglucosamine synthase-like glycosyltransferase
VLVCGLLAALAAVAWAVLLTGHGGFWRTGQRLPGAGRDSASQDPASQDPAGTSQDPAAWPGVVAVVPARDEAAILPRTLPTLLAQDYPGPFAVTLVDDASTDGTGAVATRLGAGGRGAGGGVS